jgi:hypothetical protein
MDEKAEDLK